MSVPRIVGIADTDSYVKWAAALLGTLPADAGAELLILETPLAVSAAQQAAALAGSGLPPERVRRIAYDDLGIAIARAAPDAVLIASRGPVVRVLARAVAALSPRPVILTGLPGISIPATSAALIHRVQCDLFVLHSPREVEEFTAIARRRGLAHRFALAQLPFARRTSPAADRSATTANGTDLVFASQAIVPSERADRLRIARLLVEAARADPSRRVVVKERAVRGEHQTHRERTSYPDLLAGLGPLPANLTVSTGPMSGALDTAEGLVTVSSTAAIEAVARRIPVIALDTFGVSDELINPVFEGSGLLGGEAEVIGRDFRHPTAAWRRRNYFHGAADDWMTQLEELVGQRRAGSLPHKPPRARRGGRARDAWERKLALGREDHTFSGAAMLVVGVPSRAVLRPILRAVAAGRARLGARGEPARAGAR